MSEWFCFSTSLISFTIEIWISGFPVFSPGFGIETTDRTVINQSLDLYITIGLCFILCQHQVSPSCHPCLSPLPTFSYIYYPQHTINKLTNDIRVWASCDVSSLYQLYKVEQTLTLAAVSFLPRETLPADQLYLLRVWSTAAHLTSCLLHLSKAVRAEWLRCTACHQNTSPGCCAECGGP